MSTAPYYLRNARYGYKSGNGELLDPNTESQPKSQPEDMYGTFTMGMTAENLADKYGITREEQDEFAYSSHVRAVAAIDAGRFKDEIVPVSVRVGKGETALVDTDEGPRRDTSVEKMAKLKPVFKAGGTVTAGNSSSRNDGAAAVVVMSEDKAAELGIKPLARFVAAGIAGVNPTIMGIGPVPATRKALGRAGLKLDDVGLIELNEAFAAQSLAVVQRAGHQPGDPQRQRRGHCAGASARLLRNAHLGYIDSRDAAKKGQVRARDHLCCGRPRCVDNLRRSVRLRAGGSVYGL